MASENTSPSEIILYQTEDDRTRVDVRFVGETVWLSLNQMVELLGAINRSFHVMPAMSLKKVNW